MKKNLLILLAVFGLSFLNGVSQTAVPGCVDGKIYLKYKSNAGIKVANPVNIDPQALPGVKELINKYGINFAEKPYYQATDSKDLMRIYKLGFTSLTQVDDLIRDLSINPLVEYAEKVPLCVTSYTTNDPSGPNLSGNQWFLNKINAATAWNVYNGTSTITVAVVDNAIQRTHVDLVANIWTNPGEIPGNLIDDDGNGYIDDVNGYDVGDNDNVVLPLNTSWSHGTHCSGIVGARTDNTVGISAIGFNVKIIPVKATANSAGSNAVSAGYAGIVYASRCNAKVISCSWGGTVSAVSDQAVIDYAFNRGAIIVAAAANDGNQVLHYPGAYNNVYCVASSGSGDIKSGFSCYGTWVDITAPGESIYSTVPNNSYTNMQGTSMATPLVAGLAGLMLSKNPYMTPTQVANCISSSAVNIYTLAGNSTYAPNKLGAGRIDAYQAMICASVTAGSPPSVDFTSDKQNTCPGNPIKFFDGSTLYPTTWSWTFQGGTPATSSVKNPTVTWAAAGTYSVALTATNLYGGGSKTKIGYITISNPGSLPLVEGFQGAPWPPVNWVNDNTFSDSVLWTRATNAGGFGTSSASALFDNYYRDASGIRDGLMAPKLNFGSVTNARLRFDIAYRRYDATYSDTLEVKISTNCGLTWTSVYMKGGTALSTAPDYTVDLWVPTAAQWRRDTIDISPVVAGQPNVLIDFVNHGHYGQGIYLDNVNLVYTVTAAPIANYNYPAALCAGASITFTDVSTNSPTSWSWNIPGSSVPTSTLQNPTVTYTAAGVYSATLTATNVGGNSVSIKTFTVSTMPTVSTGGSNAICVGTSGTITASGATTYTWQPGGMTGASVVVTPTVNTTYTVTGANGACANANTKVLTVNPNPTVAVNSSTICTGGTATLTASGATTYSWNTGATTAGINPTPASTTVYTVTGTTSGCNNIRTATVTVAPAPTVSVNSSTICIGNSTNLTASGASTYSWNTGATTTSISVTPTVTTTYTVTGANGTCTNVKTTTVTVNALPSVSLAASSGTACTSATGGITLTLTGSPAGGVYSGTGVTGTSFVPQATAGTYTATYSYTNVTTGCSRSVSTNIIVNVCTGINKVSILDGKITVFPNPNNGIFTIQANIEDAFDLNIYNNLGQLVKTKHNLKGVNEISLNEFGRGIYSVVIKVNNDYKTVKMVIE